MIEKTEEHAERATSNKKKPKARRPEPEVVADLERRLARHRWKDPKKALELVLEALELLAEAEARSKQIEAALPMWTTARKVLSSIHEAISTAIPEEAR